MIQAHKGGDDGVRIKTVAFGCQLDGLANMVGHNPSCGMGDTKNPREYGFPSDDT